MQISQKIPSNKVRQKERKREMKSLSLIIGCIARKSLLVFISINIPRKREGKSRIESTRFLYIKEFNDYSYFNI